MKKVMTAVALFVALSAFAVEVDGIAARVGSSVILKSAVLGEMRRAGVGEEKYAEVRGEMIERELILKAAARAKLQMQDWVVENRVREIVSRMFGGDANRFKAALARDRVTFPEWRQRVKDDMVVSAMRWQTVDKTVSANPADMRREYESHPERYMTDSRVTVSAILIGPGDADKKPEIEEALKTEPFAEVAKKYSSDARAKEKGETSKWIELDGWNFLVRKDDEKAGSKMTFEEAYDAVAFNVRKELADKRYREWIDRLKAETYIKIY